MAVRGGLHRAFLAQDGDAPRVERTAGDGGKAVRVDALRRAIEANSPETYASRGYYEKWLYAVRDLLVEQEVLAPAEIEARISALRAAEQGGVAA